MLQLQEVFAQLYEPAPVPALKRRVACALVCMYRTAIDVIFVNQRHRQTNITNWLLAVVADYAGMSASVGRSNNRNHVFLLEK